MDHRAGADVSRLITELRANSADSRQAGDGGAKGPQFTGPLDTVPDDITTTVTLTVDGAHVVSSIDAIGDKDFFKVQLVEGELYDFGMYQKAGGPTLVPLPDAYLEIYDADGELVTSADGGGPNTPSGLDVLTTFEAGYTGTYYINARAFDQDGTNGTDGDGIGDYELFAKTGDPNAYQPYYDTDSPLHAIDWGTQIDGTTRNPDGDQGPRDNGEAYEPTKTEFGIEGKNVVTYYLAKQGEVYVDEDPTTPGSTETMVAKGWSDWEIDALEVAFDQYEQFSDLVYVEVDNREQADFRFLTYLGTPGPGVSLLGRMSPPGEENAGQAEFNAADERWNEAGLSQGGFTFVTLIHEMGHGHGLAHPHDNGGHSSVMRGVEANGPAFDYTTGDFGLNQGVYTMMSYQDGWEESPYGSADTQDPNGWLGGPMAFDIAALQDKYGVNEDYATGNDTYVLKDENAPGTFYDCIWDAGGKDSLRYDGARNANIDLRAATLQYEEGGGGWISFATGIYGGYTIANGVTIENATGGTGRDRLTGNDVDNRLDGGDGNDRLSGLKGVDDLRGGAGKDIVYGGSGDDLITGGFGNDLMVGGQGADTFAFTAIAPGKEVDKIRGLESSDLIDLSRIDADAGRGGNQAFHLVDAFTHTAGEAILVHSEARDRTFLLLDDDGDGKIDLKLVMDGDQTTFDGLTL
jgi:serralysin